MNWLRANLVCLLLGVGCTSTGVGNPGIGQKDQALIADGNDAMSAGDTASALNSMVTLAFDESTVASNGEELAVLAESRTPLFFEPAGCMTTVRSAATVTFSFDGCRTGAFGLVELEGALAATYRLDAPGSVGVTVSTEPVLQLGAQEISLQTESFLTVGQEERTVVWNGRLQIKRPLRPDINHEASYSAVYDASTQCLRLDGSATTLFDEDEGVETSITDYRRCGPRGSCPTSGELVLTGLPARERTLTLEYDGDDTAWVAELEADVELTCRQ